MKRPLNLVLENRQIREHILVYETLGVWRYLKSVSEVNCSRFYFVFSNIQLTAKKTNYEKEKFFEQIYAHFNGVTFDGIMQ